PATACATLHLKVPSAGNGQDPRQALSSQAKAPFHFRSLARLIPGESPRLGVFQVNVLLNRLPRPGGGLALRRQRLALVICTEAVNYFRAEDVSRSHLAEVCKSLKLAGVKHCLCDRFQAFLETGHGYEDGLRHYAVNQRFLLVGPFASSVGVHRIRWFSRKLAQRGHRGQDLISGPGGACPAFGPDRLPLHVVGGDHAAQQRDQAASESGEERPHAPSVPPGGGQRPSRPESVLS